VKTNTFYLLTTLLCLIGLSACQPTAGNNDRHEVIVFAAASLTDAFLELADTFEAEHPDTEVVLNFGSSSQLAAQLSEGALANVYASANEKQMQVVIDAGRITSPVQLFASNRLVIIIPADNPANITDLSGLSQPGLRLVTAVPGVPIRQYTDDMLGTLSADPNYGPDYQQAVYDNVVSEEDTVRLVAAKVALGEANAAVVYMTDVTPDITSDVRQIAIPNDYNVLAAYPIGLIDDAPGPELGQTFIDFVLEEQGQAILEKWGFGPAPTPQ
jgi:molybdate transport system substrate-binding protein